MNKLTYFIGIIAAALMCASCFAQERLLVPQVKNEQDLFAVNLLSKALQSENQPLRMLQYRDDLSLQGKVEALKHQDINVAWFSADANLSDALIAIEIPIYKGAMSYYQLVTESPMPKIRDEHLTSMSFGMLRADAKSVQLNNSGLTVAAAPSLYSLGEMLSGNRFDAVMLPLFSSQQLAKSIGGTTQPVIVSSLNPYYFYVDKSDPALATRIKVRLEAMHQDGSLAKAFYDEPWVDIALTKLQGGGFEVLNITTLETTLAAQQINRDYWLNLKQGPLFTQVF